ncbi:MAG: cellulase family glycosylhydrolase, partial [Pseudomonadota bacterium]
MNVVGQFPGVDAVTGALPRVWQRNGHVVEEIAPGSVYDFAYCSPSIADTHQTDGMKAQTSIKSLRAWTMKIFSRLLTTIVLALAVTATVAKADGFRVQGSQLIDANGIPFLMRGINHPHAWYANRIEQSMADIAATKANVVRVVLSAGEPWVKTSADEVEFIIELAKRNSLIVMFEVHNTTG